MPPLDKPRAVAAFARLIDTLEILRSPAGCPWDREQTAPSLRKAVVEEAYELVHAITHSDLGHQQEELGDVYLVASLIGVIEEETGHYSLGDTLEALVQKLIFRHPHVFGDAVAADAGAVVTQWEALKKIERARRGQTSTSLLDGVGRELPELERAVKVQKKAAETGFDWDGPEGIFDKIVEETAEVRAELAPTEGPPADPAARDRLELELGDLLFAVVNLCRWLKVPPAQALDRSIEKFKRRFARIEEGLAAEGRPLAPESRARMEELWNAQRGSST